jgi:hypothetical protein
MELSWCQETNTGLKNAIFGGFKTWSKNCVKNEKMGGEFLSNIVEVLKTQHRKSGVHYY